MNLINIYKIWFKHFNTDRQKFVDKKYFDKILSVNFNQLTSEIKINF